MRVLFIILLVAITFVLPNWVFGQTVDNKFNLKEFYPKSTKKILSNPTDPISDWPECSAPKDIIVQESKNGYFISWDGEEKKSSNYYYELKLVNNNRFEDVIQLTRNTYFIEHSKFLRTENPVHNIRRVCVLENNKVINSIWIQFAISGGGDGGGPCSASGGTIVGPNCAFLGSNFTISSSSSPTGCSTGNYAYQWQSSTSQNNGFQNISNSNSPSLTTSINNLNAGTYYFRRLVYCVDGDFCQSTASYLSSNTTSVYLQNSFNATISGNGLIQCGQSTTLTASGGGTYIWSHNLGSGANKNVTPSSTTTYTVTVTNSNGCTQTAIKTVTVSGLPNVSISGTSNINCGQSVTMTASGGVSYTWSHNLGNGSSKTVTPNSTTTYTVTITGSNGCTNTGQKTITITNAPNLTISGNNNICSGQSTTLTAYGGSTYTWSNNLGTGSIKTVSPTTSTTYTVTATSTGGCTASKEVSITVLPTPSAIITGNSNLCAGQSTTLTITGGGTYLWSDNLGSNSSVTVTPNSTKTYQATVTSSNGCTAIASKTITVSPIPIASITGSNSVCSGNSLVLTASGGFFYDWSNNLGSTNEVIVTPLSSTTYSVTVSSAGGCSAVANKSISVLPTPIALITGDGEICNGQSTTLSASGGNSYLWSNSNTSQSITVMPTENTVYKVTVTNSQNCTSDASFDVKIAANFNFTYTVNDPSPCNENSGSIVFDAPSGSSYSYSINGGSFQSSSTFNGLTAGQYTINVMNNIDNCVSENIVVTINPVACDIDPKKLCDIYANLKGLILTESSFNIVMSDDLNTILSNLQINNLAVLNILSKIDKLDLQISYQNVQGQAVSELKNIYSESMYPDPTTFDLSTWATEISGISTSNFVGSYKLLITLNDGTVLECLETTLTLTNEDIDEDEPSNIEGLPILNCDSNLDEPENTASELTNASPGELFYIKEFPILLTEVRPNNGTFSGSGIIPVPFNSSYLLVEFTNVSVNLNRKITSGTVLAVPGDPVTCTAPSVSFGGDICVPPPPPPSFSGPGGTDINGYNSYGFDPVTKLHKNGTLYDANGFDFNGNYQGTEPPSPYNQLGCDRDGYDINGNKCDPTQHPLPEVVKFLDDNQNNFGPKQISILEELRQEYLLKLQNLNCESFRSKINLELQKPEIALYSSVVAGASQEYLGLGMSNNFSTPLKELDYDDSRKSESVKIMETNQAKLYDCDVKSIKYNKIVGRINAILADAVLLEQILDEIKDKIVKWNAEEISKYGDINSSEFKDWMKEQLKAKIMELENDNTLFSYLNKVQSKPYQIHKINNQVDYIDYYHSLASIDNTFGKSISISEKEEIAYYLQNGFNSIKGIDKVHYLEAMTSMISANATAVPNVMPLKVSNSVGSMIYTVFLDNFVFTTTQASFDACIKIEDTESGKMLVFRATGITFGAGGTTVPFKLALVNDEVSIRINNAAKIHLFKDKTYVEFDCKGFKGAGIKADIEFCPEYILPIDAAGKVISNTHYKLHIEELTMNKWMEFTHTMSAPPFAMAKYENIQWQITNMVIDTDSEGGSSVNITPPMDFESSVDLNSGSWKGFYVESLKVKFLSELPSSSSSPVEISVNNLIIDGTGVSAYAAATHDILNNGNMSGWPFTINKVSLLVLHNNVAGFGFGGDLKLPLFNEFVGYKAEVYSGGKYKFEVNLSENLNCPLFIANAKIFDNSNVSVIYDGTHFVASATLNGELSIKNDLIPGINGVIPTIGVTGMQLSTKAPYFNIGSWDLKGNTVGLDFGAFEIGIGLPSGFKPAGDDSNGVLLPIRLELDGQYKITANGNFAILGHLEGTGGGIHNWKYEKTEIREFCIGGSFPGVKSINGCLKYFDESTAGVDAKWGKGFQASVQVKFDKFLNQIDAVGCFGKSPQGFKYFYIDASASLQNSIPMGAISLKGFCGGVSNRMSSTFDPNALNFTDAFNPNLAVGQSASGIVYTPDNTKGLGLNAGATFVLTALPSLTNGSLLIKMSFNTNGGLDEFGMKGTAKFLEIPGQLLPFVAAIGKPDIEAVIAANVDLKINSAGIFGKFECYLNADPIMVGIGAEGKLVDAVVQFTSSEWFIWIGQPEPKSLRSGVSILGVMEVDAYFCMGSKIPDFPEIPYEVRKHLSGFASTKGLRGGGGGLVFGASFEVEASVNAFVAAAKVQALGGFDIMLRDYSNMNCGGDPVGLNGWYGAGQAWAMLSGELKAFGVNVFSATVAAAFQARLPKPTFIEAALSIEACLIKCFDVDMHVTIGEVCNFQSNDPNNVLGTQIVSSIIPFDKTQNMALESQPQIYFNVPIQDGVKIKDVSGNEKSYDIKIKTLELRSKSLNIPLAIETTFNSTKTLVTVKPKYLLPHNDSLELIIVTEVYDMGSLIQTETKTSTFYTADALPSFSNSVKTSYPKEGMTNFYKDEVIDEFIVLKQLIYDYINESEASIALKLVSKGSTEGVTIPFTVADYGKKLVFDISPYLNKVTHYELKIFKITSEQDGQTEYQNELLSIPFRTSNFSTFAEKVSSFSETDLAGNDPNHNTHKVEFATEPFDEIELKSKLVTYSLDREYDYSTINSYTTYSDEFIVEYCNVPMLPGCPGCLSGLGTLSKTNLILNKNHYAEYKTNVRTYLKPYMDIIFGEIGYFPEDVEFYKFYLAGTTNFRDHHDSGSRAEAAPRIVLYYYTPDGTKMSAQVVK